jgi:MinD-like ATPase involved in chromosome partitioning or flagellar assembly
MRPDYTAGANLGADQLDGFLRRVAEVSDGPRLPAWRRGLRALGLGLTAPSAAAAMDRERALVARVRTRRSAPRLAAVVAGKGGVGTTTVAAGVALTLASLRHDTTTLLDPRHGTGSLGRRLAGQPAPTVTQLADCRPGLPGPDPLRVRGVLGVVDGAPWHSPASLAELAAVLDRLRDEFGFAVVDVGNDVSEVADSVLLRADQVVVVTTAAQDAVESTRVTLLRVRQVEPRLVGTAVVAIACLTAGQYRRTARRLRVDLGLPGQRIVAVPYDPVLAAGGPLEPGRLRPASREALLRLAGFLADPGEPGRDLAVPVPDLDRPVFAAVPPLQPPPPPLWPAPPPPPLPAPPVPMPPVWRPSR